MKILFISQYFYPEPFSNQDLAQALVNNGHDVDVVCCVPNYPEGRFYPGYSNRANRTEKWNGVNVFRARTVARGATPIRLALNYLSYPVFSLFSIWRMHRRGHDVSFTSMPSPIFQALVAIGIKIWRGVPAVYWVQDIWPESLLDTLKIRSPFVYSILRSFCGWIYRQADCVLVQSEAFRLKLVSMGVDNAKIVFFPNSSPIQFSSGTPSAATDELIALARPCQLRLVFAGNVGESQNLDVLVKAALFLQDIDLQWLIVGSGRDLARLKSAVIEAGLSSRFLFTGRLDIEHMPYIYSLADAMLLPLKDTSIFRLTVPYKLQSYLAAGKPVIGSIGGETKRIIELGAFGYCAEPDDAQDLALLIRQFAALTPARREEMGLSARIYFDENFSPEKVYRILENALSDCSK
jgi:colanic acid biosynthesis glycosyl transferase WcaI